MHLTGHATQRLQAGLLIWGLATMIWLGMIPLVLCQGATGDRRIEKGIPAMCCQEPQPAAGTRCCAPETETCVDVAIAPVVRRPDRVQQEPLQLVMPDIWLPAQVVLHWPGVEPRSPEGLLRIVPDAPSLTLLLMRSVVLLM